MTLPLQITLSDVARLARVQRPVVSMWRRRSAAGPAPFPVPFATVRGEDRFRAEEVVDWLVQTDRGNHADVRADVAAFASLRASTVEDDAVLFHGLTALLCLKAVEGERLAGLTDDELLELADDADPDDNFLVAEIEALGGKRRPVAEYADTFADASYHPAAAFEKLMSGRFRFALAGHVSTALAQPMHDLVASLAIALARDAGMDPAVYVDPTPGGSDLLVSLMTSAQPEEAATVLTRADGGATARLARRRLRLHGIHRLDLPIDGQGSPAVADPAVYVACYPSPGDPTISPDAILTAIDNVQLAMRDDQRAVIVAPASVLTDRLAGRALDAARDQVVRTGRLRAVVRLPSGLVSTRPRQALALWVLGPAYERVAPVDRWTCVADLSDTSLSPESTQDLVSDVVAAMGDLRTVRSHAFRFAHVVLTRSLLAGRALVAPGVAAPHPERVSAAAIAVRVGELRTSLSPGPVTEPMSGAVVSVRDGEASTARMTLAAASADGLVRIVPGNRLGRGDLGEAGARVIGVEELTGERPVGERRIEPTVFAHYDAGRYTEAGDVVWCTSPRPRAMVDGEGGSVVAYPARVLRLAWASGSRGLLPALVATDINDVPSQARAWRSWSVRVVPSDQAESLSAVLADIDGHEADLAARVCRLHDLRRLVVQGVASRALTVSPQSHLPAP